MKITPDHLTQDGLLGREEPRETDKITDFQNVGYRDSAIMTKLRPHMDDLRKYVVKHKHNIAIGGAAAAATLAVLAAAVVAKGSSSRIQDTENVPMGLSLTMPGSQDTESVPMGLALTMPGSQDKFDELLVEVDESANEPDPQSGDIEVVDVTTFPVPPHTSIFPPVSKGVEPSTIPDFFGNVSKTQGMATE